jgi:hypothetical protein
MATRRGPGDPVDPFASLPLGQTLSGDRERERDAARRALDESAVVSEQAIRTAETIAALRETPDEASPNVRYLGLTPQDIVEQTRQRTLREAREREQQAAERSSRLVQARQEQARLDAARAEEARRDDASFERDMAERRGRALADSPDAHTLRVIEQRLQRKVEAVQRVLTALTEDLADVQQTLEKKAPAPTGNEEAPFREGERHLDLGGNE